MIAFAVLFSALVVVSTTWVFTIPRRLKGRGLGALGDMVPVRIEEAEIIALSSRLDDQIGQYQKVWDTIGGTKGLKDLHHNAACLIEAWSNCEHPEVAEEDRELNKRLYGLGFCVVLAFIESLGNRIIRFVTRSPFIGVPVVHGTIAVALYAEIQTRIRTLFEAFRPDLLEAMASKI